MVLYLNLSSVCVCGLSTYSHLFLCQLMQEVAVKLDIIVEPSFITLGPFHMAVGINDRAWIYEIQEDGMVHVAPTQQSYYYLSLAWGVIYGCMNIGLYGMTMLQRMRKSLKLNHCSIQELEMMACNNNPIH